MGRAYPSTSVRAREERTTVGTCLDLSSVTRGKRSPERFLVLIVNSSDS